MAYKLEIAKGKKKLAYMRYLSYVKIWFDTFLTDNAIELELAEIGKALVNQSTFMATPFDIKIDVYETDKVVTASCSKDNTVLLSICIVEN